MKRIGLILIAIHLLAFPMFSQTVSIPDATFLYALIEEGVDADKDSLISYEEAEAVTAIDISGPWYWDDGGFKGEGEIKDITGIEAFIKLDSLDCGINLLTSLDVSNNTALNYLSCGGNQLTSLDVSNCIDLKYLDASGFARGVNIYQLHASNQKQNTVYTK